MYTQINDTSMCIDYIYLNVTRRIRMFDLKERNS